jgi:hypothetical protein
MVIVDSRILEEVDNMHFGVHNGGDYWTKSPFMVTVDSRSLEEVDNMHIGVHNSGDCWTRSPFMVLMIPQIVNK